MSSEIVVPQFVIFYEHAEGLSEKSKRYLILIFYCMFITDGQSPFTSHNRIKERNSHDKM